MLLGFFPWPPNLVGGGRLKAGRGHNFRESCSHSALSPMRSTWGKTLIEAGNEKTPRFVSVQLITVGFAK